MNESEQNSERLQKMQEAFDRWKSGDDTAFGTLLALIYPAFRPPGTWHVGGSPVRHSDVLQELMVFLLERNASSRSPSLRDKTENLSQLMAYCNMKIGFMYPDLLDKIQRVPPLPPGMEKTSSGTSPSGQLAWERFHEEIKKLPDEEQEAFRLRYYNGMSLSEIGALLGYTGRWAGELVRQARDKLRPHWPLTND